MPQAPGVDPASGYRHKKPMMMGGAISRRCGMRQWAGMLVFCALLLRFLIPAGFMPVVTDQGFAITICTGQGPVVLDLDDKGHKSPDVSAHQICAFAGIGALALAPMGRPVTVPLAPYQPPSPAPAYLTPSLGLAAPPPEPTGPPAFA